MYTHKIMPAMSNFHKNAIEMEGKCDRNVSEKLISFQWSFLAKSLAFLLHF